MAARNALESPLRAGGVIVSLGLALAAGGVVVIVALAFGGQVRTSMLGEVVALRVGWYHGLAVGAALFAAGSLALSAGLLAVDRRIGLIGTLRAVGWRLRETRRLLAFEVATAPLIAGALAAVVVAAAAALTGASPLLTILLPCSLLAGALAVSIVVAIPTARLATEAPAAMSLRAEGATSSLPGLAQRSALLAVGALAVAVAVVSAGWGLFAPAAIPPGAFVGAPTPPPPDPAIIAMEADVAAIAAFPDRRPGSESMEAAFAYVRAELLRVGASVETLSFVAREPEWLRSDGASATPDGLVRPLAVAYAADVRGGESLAITLVPAAGTHACVPAAVLRASDDSGADLAMAYLSGCAAEGTTLALAVEADEEGWQELGRLASVRLPDAMHLVAEVGVVQPDTPWLVVALDSTGPGATQSAAPAAVALALGRSAAHAGLPVRIAFVSGTGGGALSQFLSHVADSTPAAPIMELGPMGGPLSVVYGSSPAPGALDVDSVRAGLLSSLRLGPATDRWLDRITTVVPRATDDRLLQELAQVIAGPPTQDGLISLYALSVGLDAAYLGEPLQAVGDVGSIAGTTVDTPDQVDARSLSQLRERLLLAIEGCTGG